MANDKDNEKAAETSPDEEAEALLLAELDAEGAGTSDGKDGY